MADTEQTARSGDVRRITDVLRPIMVALDGATAVLRAKEEFENDRTTREDQLATMEHRKIDLDTRLNDLRTQYSELDGKLEDERVKLAADIASERETASQAIADIRKEVEVMRAEAAAVKTTSDQLISLAKDNAAKAIANIEADAKARKDRIDLEIYEAETRLQDVKAALDELKKKF